jgi:predicted DNA-binding transcriptional regulator AlpA
MTAVSRLTRSETQPRRGLRREEAAAYVGLSPSTFDNMVRAGKLPMPKKWGAASVWDMRLLDQAAFGDSPPNANDNPFD